MSDFFTAISPESALHDLSEATSSDRDALETIATIALGRYLLRAIESDKVSFEQIKHLISGE